EVHRGLARFRGSIHGIAWDARNPEETTRGDRGTVVVDLMIEVNLTVIEVQSDEVEGTVMVLSVHADVAPFHESHVGSEQERHLHAGLGIRARPRAEDPTIADVAGKVGDLRRFVLGSRREVVDGELFVADGDGDAPGNRFW